MEQVGQNKMMADVCRGLSQICKILVKEEKKKITIEKNKLKMVEKHKIKGIVKSVVKKNIKGLNKFAERFERYSKVFDDFSKLHKISEKEVKKEWKKINNQK